MLDHLMARDLIGQAGSIEPKTQLELIATTHQLFNQALLRGKWARLSAWISRQPTHLLRLEQVGANKIITGRHSVGTRVVEIRKIQGSSGRPNDFDIDFNPVQVHTENRWINVAKAYLTGITLPPVKLVQLGDSYFVQDGHHRISVAKALGQLDIDAEVTVWNYVELVQPCGSIRPCLNGCSPVLNGQLRCS